MIKLLALLFILVSLAGGQTHNAVEEWLTLWNEYKGECYADSTLEVYIVDGGWMEASVYFKWIDRTLFPFVTDYRYFHRPATLEGFISFLETKAWLWRSKERVNEMREVLRRVSKND